MDRFDYTNATHFRQFLIGVIVNKKIQPLFSAKKVIFSFVWTAASIPFK